MAHLLGTLAASRGTALEALTGDRGGGARRSRPCGFRRRRLVRRRLQNPRHGIAERDRPARPALPGRVGRYRERRLRRGVGHASRAGAARRHRADHRGDRRPAACHRRAEPVRQGQRPALRGRAHRLRAGPVRRHRVRARQGAGRAARGGVRARRSRRYRGLPQRRGGGPGRADHRARSAS